MPPSRARADGGCHVAGAVRLGSRRAVDVVTEALDRAERAHHLGAFTKLHPDHALAHAARVDALIAAGENPGRLAGVPIAVKDNIAHAGMPMTAASRMLEGYIAPRTATALGRLEAEGAVVIGRTNMDDRHGLDGENSAIGPTLNPSTTTTSRRLVLWLCCGNAAGIVPLALAQTPAGVSAARQLLRRGRTQADRSNQSLGSLASSSIRSTRGPECVTWPSPPTHGGDRSADSTTLSTEMGTMEAEVRPDLSDHHRILRCWQPLTSARFTNIRAAIVRLESPPASPRSGPSLEAAIPTYYLLTSAEQHPTVSVRWHSLWRAGASDDLIEAYTHAHRGPGPRFSDAFCSEPSRWLRGGRTTSTDVQMMCVPACVPRSIRH